MKKYALVTGGSRGIGRAISLKLAQDGHYVLVNYLSRKDEAQKTCALIVEAGGEAEIMQFDVSKAEAVEKAITSWQEANPEAYIQVLINNAGIRRDNLMVFMNHDEWKSVVQTNLDSMFNVTHLLLKDMLFRKKGRIINMVSTSGLKGVAGQTNYSAAKAGLIGATRSLAMEVARKKVTVNAVAPGFIRTEMTRDIDKPEFKAMVPMNRFGEPEEVADLVSFLVSDKASYITGQVISINGGILG
jgi:3-oxoacyl-[acyl-carrier protein] reductase